MWKCGFGREGEIKGDGVLESSVQVLFSSAAEATKYCRQASAGQGRAGLSQAVIDKMSALTGISGVACDSSTIYRIRCRGG